MASWTEVDGVSHAPRIIYSTTTSAQTGANTTETTLATYTMAAGLMSANGQRVSVTVALHTAANGNTKTIKLKFGSASVTLTTLSTALNNSPIVATVSYIRTGAAAELRVVESISPGGIGSSAFVPAALTEDLASSVVILVTGQNGTASAGDIVFDSMVIRYDP